MRPTGFEKFGFLFGLITCKSSGLICGLDRTDSGPGDDSIERIGEEAHLGCAEDPGKDGLEPGLGSAMIALRGTQSIVSRATLFPV